MTTGIQTTATAFTGDPNPFSRKPNTETAAFYPTVVDRRRNAPTWLADANAKIENLEGLDDNWDSYGAAPIDSDSIVQACHFISNLSFFIGVDAPAISGTPAGNVGFSWDAGDWSLDAELLPNGTIKYVYLDERDSASDRDATTTYLNDLLLLLTQWPSR